VARPFHFVLFQARCFSCRRLINLGTLAVSLLAYPVFCTSLQEDKDRDRPKLPYNMMGIQRQEIDAYDSKAEPVANATAALLAVNKTGLGGNPQIFSLARRAPEGSRKAISLG